MPRIVKYIVLNPKSSSLAAVQGKYSASEFFEYEGTSIELLETLLEMRLNKEIDWEVWIFPIDADIVSVDDALREEIYPWESLCKLGGEPVVVHTTVYVIEFLDSVLRFISTIPNVDLVDHLEKLIEVLKKKSILAFGCSYNGSEEEEVFVRYMCFICNNEIYSIDISAIVEARKNLSVQIDDIIIDKRSVDSFDSIGLYEYIKLLERKSSLSEQV